MLQRVVALLCHAGGASLFTIGKAIYNLKKIKSKSYVQWEKIKTKKVKKESYVQIPKVKTKKITNESLPVPYVIDQCSRVDRRCG